MSSAKENIKIPLMWRLRAWWHGYDLSDVQARLSKLDEKPSEKIPRASNNKSNDSNKKPEEAIVEQNEPTEDLSSINNQTVDIDDDFAFSGNDHVAVKAVWDTERAQVAQVFWGDGFCGPGGPENIITMTEPLKINTKRSTMVLGAGLGGPVRALQKEYKTPVDGFESSSKLAAMGMSMSLEAGVAQDAPIVQFDLENTTKFPRSYDRAYAKETTFILGNKAQLFLAIFNHLKKDGLFLLSDYILSEKADQDSELYKKWCKLEPFEPKPVTGLEMESYLEVAGFSIRVNEDITDFYLDLIVKARAHAKEVIASMEAVEVKDPTILRYMHNEALFWDTRAKLLRNGDLKVVKYLCHKA